MRAEAFLEVLGDELAEHEQEVNERHNLESGEADYQQAYWDFKNEIYRRVEKQVLDDKNGDCE